jgi:hypothetical protein
MADPSDNLDPKEATEAKLCAYLEGELSASERVEIEQHLKANPQHRQLLADLARTRDWMRSIPRETSPVDLGEVFQGQVERSMLLDDSADPSSGMSINRWPQYLLVAAITVLTLGLGVVLVAILKSPQQNGSGAPGAYAVQKALPSLSPTTFPMGTVSAKKSIETAPSAAITTTGTAPQADHSQILARSTGDRDAPSDAESLKTRLAAAGMRFPIEQKLVCFVVSADSPAAAAEQVRGFFDRHQIACDVTPSDKPQPIGQLNGSGGVAFGNSRNAENRFENRAATPGEQNQNGGALIQNRQVAQSAQNDLVPDTAGKTVEKAAADRTAADRTGADRAAADRAMTTDKFTPVLPGASAPGEIYYIARGITPLQLELLNASLVSNDLKQTVDRVTLNDGQLSEASKALPPSAIARGQTMTVTIPQLVGPGIEKTNVVKVTEDGTITLPMIDPIPAAGVSVPELQQRIADKYREANLIDTATVTVVVANPPATQAAIAAANRPATEPLKDAATLSKTPAAPTPATHPAPELIDVVVVIQPSRLTSPVAPPTR